MAPAGTVWFCRGPCLTSVSHVSICLRPSGAGLRTGSEGPLTQTGGQRSGGQPTAACCPHAGSQLPVWAHRGTQLSPGPGRLRWSTGAKQAKGSPRLLPQMLFPIPGTPTSSLRVRSSPLRASVFMWPDQAVLSRSRGLGMGTQPTTEGQLGEYLREGPDAFGRVPDVPHLDVGGRHGEHKPRVATVLEGHHIVGVALQGRDLLACDQVPHLTAAVCGRQGESHGDDGRQSAGAW